MAEFILDVRNMLCPMPVIKTQQRVKELTSGDCLIIKATDPGAKHDIPAWCRIYGHKLLELIEQDRELSIKIEVNG